MITIPQQAFLVLFFLFFLFPLSGAIPALPSSTLLPVREAGGVPVLPAAAGAGMLGLQAGSD